MQRRFLFRFPLGEQRWWDDALDQVVPLLIQLVDGALGRRDLQIVRHARFVLFVPELDVRQRETRDQVSDGVRHGGTI